MTRPTFAMVTPAADADERRIVTVDMIRTLTGLSTTQMSDSDMETVLDGVLADCARSCRLKAAGAYPLTLAREVVSATWIDNSARSYRYGMPYDRGHQLLLPWRAPIISIEVTEAGIELVQDTDYRLLGSGVIERILGGTTICGWAFTEVVAEYTVGWQVDDEEFPVPADIVAAIADQVKYQFNKRDMDFTLRSEDVPGIWSGSYNVPGGDAINADGLIKPLYEALQPFRGPPVFA